MLPWGDPCAANQIPTYELNPESPGRGTRADVQSPFEKRGNQLP